MVAAVVGIVTPAILVANTCNITGSDRTLLIQVSLLVTALATLDPAFPILGASARAFRWLWASALPMSPTTAGHWRAI